MQEIFVKIHNYVSRRSVRWRSTTVECARRLKNRPVTSASPSIEGIGLLNVTFYLK